MTFRIVGTVIDIQIDAGYGDPLRRQRVTVRVDRTVEGEAPAAQLELLVHSPALTFRDDDAVGEQYVIGFPDPWSEPYTGALEVRRVHD